MNDTGRNYLKYLKNKFPERQFITNINKKMHTISKMKLKLHKCIILSANNLKQISTHLSYANKTISTHTLTD